MYSVNDKGVIRSGERWKVKGFIHIRECG